jgi:type IV pilus assembly protein PilN
MIRINLLPFRAARKKENIKRQFFIFFSLLILIVLTLFYFNSMLSAKVEDLDESVVKTRAELVRTEKTAKEVDRIKKMIETLDKKMALIGELEKNRTAAVDLLQSISSLVVKDKMWLTSLSSTKEALNLSGIALDNKTVAVFLTNLEESKLYGSVNLQDLRHTTVKSVSLKAFDIECKKGAAAVKK